MIIEKELRKLFHQLIHDDVAEILLGGSHVTIRVFDQASKLSLSTSVYAGSNFIPVSVRKCLSEKAPFNPGPMKTSFSVDEPNFTIHLNYLGQVKEFNNQKFKDLLEEFSWQADEWRIFLDEHGKNDLIHVRVK